MTEMFFLLKGLTALAATILLIVHMQEEWTTNLSWGRRLRYLALLSASIAVTFSSSKQVAENQSFEGENIGGLITALLVLSAALVSIHEHRRSEG